MKTKQKVILACFLCTVLVQASVSSGQPVTRIAVGGNAGHSLFLKSDGSMWAMGDDEYGQLGDSNNISVAPYGVNRPELIVPSNVIAIATGYYHSLFIKSDGSLWAMGGNNFGELGDGTTNSVNVPEQIVPSGVTGVAAGDQDTLFIKNDGSLWGMGDNHDGTLGLDDYTGLDGSLEPDSFALPTQILANPNYNQICIKLLSGGDVLLSFDGLPMTYYALDRSYSLNPAIGRGEFGQRDKYPLPDVMLLDLKMPRMSGYDVLRWLQSHSFPSVTIIILSGSILLDDIEVSKTLGAHGFWSKTSDPAKQQLIALEIEALLDLRFASVSKV